MPDGLAWVRTWEYICRYCIYLLNLWKIVMVVCMVGICVYVCMVSGRVLCTVLHRCA